MRAIGPTTHRTSISAELAMDYFFLGSPIMDYETNS